MALTENRIGLSVTTVKKVDLLKELKINLHNHTTEYEEAIKAYKEEAIKKLEKMLKDARKVEVGEEITVCTTLPFPENHEKDYTAVIKQIEMDVREQIELTQTEFRQYVMDEWSWTDRFKNSIETYNIGKARR